MSFIFKTCGAIEGTLIFIDRVFELPPLYGSDLAQAGLVFGLGFLVQEVVVMYKLCRRNRRLKRKRNKKNGDRKTNGADAEKK